MEDFDYSTLTPGIRKTVKFLREHDFETTDSGDGITNVALGIEHALDIPMVAMVVDRDDLIAESERLLELLRPWMSTKAHIDASYSPIDEAAIILLLDFSDIDFNEMGS